MKFKTCSRLPQNTSRADPKHLSGRLHFFEQAVYPGYFIEQERPGFEAKKDVLAPYMRIPKDTPPIFLAHASDDSVAGAENSVVLYLALQRANIPAELHLYSKGGHGFGVRDKGLACSRWTDQFLSWLRDQNFLEPETK